MIASGALSGGISSSIADGSFWKGVREGLITSALNHFAHGGKDKNYLKDCNDCPNPESQLKYKAGEVFSSSNGNDYIFFDNDWHWITKEKMVTVRVHDPMEAKGYYEYKTSRENAFIGSYFVNNVSASGWKSGLGFSTATGTATTTYNFKTKVENLIKNPYKLIIKSSVAVTILTFYGNFLEAGNFRAQQILNNNIRHNNHVNTFNYR